MSQLCDLGVDWVGKQVTYEDTVRRSSFQLSAANFNLLTLTTTWPSVKTMYHSCKSTMHLFFSLVAVTVQLLCSFQQGDHVLFQLPLQALYRQSFCLLI